MVLEGFAPAGKMMLSGLGSMKWIFGGLLVIGLIFAAIYVISTIVRSRQKWNMLIRVRAEDTQNKKIYLNAVEVPARRVTLSNGARMILLQKEILGKRLFPILNYHTTPGVHDIIITTDQRIFIIDGIEGIDEQRKALKVGIRWPGIDYSLEEVNRDQAALNKEDRKSDLLGIVKAAATAIVAIVLLVGFIIAGHYWLEAKKVDKEKAQIEMQLFESIKASNLQNEEHTNAMILLTDKMKNMLESDNLRLDLQEAGAG